MKEYKLKNGDIIRSHHICKKTHLLSLLNFGKRIYIPSKVEKIPITKDKTHRFVLGNIYTKPYQKNLIRYELVVGGNFDKECDVESQKESEKKKHLSESLSKKKWNEYMGKIFRRGDIV